MEEIMETINLENVLSNVEELKKTDADKLKIMSVGQLRKLPKSRKVWIAEGLLPVGCTILAGTPKSYKTYLGIYLANCLSSKTAIFGKFGVTQKQEVLILDRENSDALIRDRTKQLGVSSRAKIKWSFACDPISNLAFRETLLSYLKEEKITFLIIDSFRRFHTGDENSSEEVARTFQFTDQIKALGISILILHHNRKEPLIGKSPADEMLRGSSDLTAYPDCVLTIKRIIEDAEIILKIEQPLLRTAEPISPFTLTIAHPAEGKIDFTYRAELPSEIEKPTIAQNAIYELVEEKGSVTRQDVHDKLAKTCGRDFLDKQLRRMVEDKFLTKDSGKNNQNIYRKPTEQEQLLMEQNEQN